MRCGSSLLPSFGEARARLVGGPVEPDNEHPGNRFAGETMTFKLGEWEKTRARCPYRCKRCGAVHRVWLSLIQPPQWNN
jgi:hypothetical protein